MKYWKASCDNVEDHEFELTMLRDNGTSHCTLKLDRDDLKQLSKIFERALSLWDEKSDTELRITYF